MITLTFQRGSTNTVLNNFTLSATAQMEKSTDINSIPLNIQQDANGLILDWDDPEFLLQTAPAVGGTYTNVPGASIPYTNTITSPAQFFRLKAN